MGDPDKDGWTEIAWVHRADDARLIAAAPLLLDAARRTLDYLGKYEEQLPDHILSEELFLTLRRVTAKAEGKQ